MSTHESELGMTRWYSERDFIQYGGVEGRFVYLLISDLPPDTVIVQECGTEGQGCLLVRHARSTHKVPFGARPFLVHLDNTGRIHSQTIDVPHAEITATLKGFREDYCVRKQRAQELLKRLHGLSGHANGKI